MPIDEPVADDVSTSAQQDEENVPDVQPNTSNFNCLACKSNIDDSKTRSVQCAGCYQWSHAKCAVNKEVFDMLTKITKKDSSNKKTMVLQGMVAYLCTGCQANLKSSYTNAKSVSETPTPAEDVQKAATNPIQSVFTSSSTQTLNNSKLQQMLVENDAGDPIHSNTQRVVDPKPQLHKPICYLYKQGKCPHGSSGKKLVNGQQCNYSHPRKCLKFCRFGQDINQGCAGPCDLLHPILCRNSVRYKRCLSENCTFAHLMGTERYRQPTQSQQNIQYQSFPLNNHGYSTYKSHDTRKPSSFNYSRKENEGFVYNSSNFPPLSQSSPSTRIDEMSNSIAKIQQSIEFLMQNINSNRYSPPSQP